MRKFIEAQAAGFFSPKDGGDCKLTIIIPKEAVDAQNFAFAYLRNQKVVIGLPDDAEEAQGDMPTDTTLQSAISKLNDALGILATLKLALPVISTTEETENPFAFPEEAK